MAVESATLVRFRPPASAEFLPPLGYYPPPLHRAQYQSVPGRGQCKNSSTIVLNSTLELSTLRLDIVCVQMLGAALWHTSRRPEMVGGYPCYLSVLVRFDNPLRCCAWSQVLRHGIHLARSATQISCARIGKLSNLAAGRVEMGSTGDIEWLMCDCRYNHT